MAHVAGKNEKRSRRVLVEPGLNTTRLDLRLSHVCLFLLVSISPPLDKAYSTWWEKIVAWKPQAYICLSLGSSKESELQGKSLGAVLHLGDDLKRHEGLRK